MQRNDTHSLPTQLRAWRAKRGLSQTQAAALLGRSRRVLENWEQGRSAPRGQARVALLALLAQIGAKP